MSATSTYPITITQGADFRLQLTWENPAPTPVNLSGYTAIMQIRASWESASAVLSMTQANGIALGGAAGTIIVTRSAAQTAALVVPAGTRPLQRAGLPVYEIGVYDLVLVSAAGATRRLLQGEVFLSPAVSR